MVAKCRFYNDHRFTGKYFGSPEKWKICLLRLERDMCQQQRVDVILKGIGLNQLRAENGVHVCPSHMHSTVLLFCERQTPTRNSILISLSRIEISEFLKTELSPQLETEDLISQASCKPPV